MDRFRSQRNSRFSASALLTLLCVALLADGALAATTVNVGRSSVLKYDPRLHNVLLVSKADFDACRTTAPWAKYSSGKDYVKFTKSGTYYLICGVARHCAAGMKVAVTVKW
ncbi:hypothetical protein R1flu_014117 [Riccia fluitans]|uniref:Phytocyanin domain-containing protein n=1 Tax=Riccia fluitans TaxID=41844 RepID=A0ABD1YF74_9MARC